MSNFLNELKRRKVFRTATTYAVVAFIIMQIVEIVFPMFDIPNWAGRMIIIMLFLGFPVAIIFAWIFEKTPDGRIQKEKKTDDNRPLTRKKRTWFAMGGIASGIILGIFFARIYFVDDLGENSISNKSIAVLPFTPFTVSEENQSFADGITDVILTQLAKINDLKVISRTSIMKYRNTEKNIKQIARELGVSSVLEGSIQRAGDKIRIVSQLIDTRTDEHLWAETYDRNYSDIFAIQSDVAQKIAMALKATLTPEEKTLIDKKPTQNMEAYDYFLKGKHYWDTKTTQEGNQKAVDMLTRATELDPNFALAYAWIGLTNSILYGNDSWDHTEARKEMAKRAINTAIALDPDNPEVHFAHGVYLDACLYDSKAALKEIKLAFEGEPNNGEIAQYLGNTYWTLGDWEKAEKYLLKGYELDPRGLNSALQVGRFFHYHRRFQEAEKFLKIAIQSDPEQAFYYIGLSEIYSGGFGNLTKARDVIHQGQMNLPDFGQLARSQFWIDILAGKPAVALQYAQMYKKDYPFSNILAFAYFFLGDEKLAHSEYDTMRNYFENRLKKEPENAIWHSRLGIIYAFMGLKNKAIEEGQKGIELTPADKDYRAWIFTNDIMSSIYILTEDYDLALNKIEQLLNNPGYMSKWKLRLNPLYDPLRDDPRFKKLVVGD